MKKLLLISAVIIDFLNLAPTRAQNNPHLIVPFAVLGLGQIPSKPKASRNGVGNSNILTSKWIGGLKSGDQPVLAISLDLTQASTILNVWLRSGELRVFHLEEEQKEQTVRLRK